MFLTQADSYGSYRSYRRYGRRGGDGQPSLVRKPTQKTMEINIHPRRIERTRSRFSLLTVLTLFTAKLTYPRKNPLRSALSITPNIPHPPICLQNMGRPLMGLPKRDLRTARVRRTRPSRRVL